MLTRVGLGLAAALALALAAPPTQAQGLTKLILQAGAPAPNLGYDDIYVAQKAGFFKAEGLDVEIRHATNASQAAQIVASGGADFGRFTFEPVLLGYDKGLRGKVFYQFYTHLIYFIGIPEASPLKTLADLRGKNVGVVNMGAAGVVVIHSMERNAGMPADAINLLPVGLGDAALSALHSNRVDAFMLWDEVYANMMNTGQKFRFIHYQKLNDVGDGGYFTTDRVMTEKKAAMQGAARALAKAKVFMQANFEAAAKIYLTVNPDAKSGHSEDEAIRRAVAQLQFDSQDWANPDTDQKIGEIDTAKLQDYADVLHQEGAIPAAMPVKDVVTNDLIPGANDFDRAKIREMAKGWK